MQELCSSPVSSWTIPRPAPNTVSLFQNVNRDSSLFLRAAGIEKNSSLHKELQTTVRELSRSHLDPYKHLEEQAPARVDQLISQAQLTLPWLSKYEDAWPARIYLKRYVDMKRPHLSWSKFHHRRQSAKLKAQNTQKAAGFSSQATVSPTTDSGNIPMSGDDVYVKEFLGSLTPNLEHHLNAFVKLGIKDQKTLVAFLSWPEIYQARFLREGHEVLQLTDLEKNGLLLGCGHLLQKLSLGLLANVVESGCYH